MKSVRSLSSSSYRGRSWESREIESHSPLYHLSIAGPSGAKDERLVLINFDFVIIKLVLINNAFYEYSCGVGQGGNQGKGWAMPPVLLPAL